MSDARYQPPQEWTLGALDGIFMFTALDACRLVREELALSEADAERATGYSVHDWRHWEKLGELGYMRAIVSRCSPSPAASLLLFIAEHERVVQCGELLDGKAAPTEPRARLADVVQRAARIGILTQRAMGDTASDTAASAVAEHMRQMQLKAALARTPWRPIARAALREEMATRWSMTNEEAALWLRDDEPRMARLKASGFPGTVKQVAEWIGEERKVYQPGVIDPEIAGLPPKGTRS